MKAILQLQMLMDGECGANYTPILKQYQAKAEFFLCSCLQKNNGDNVNRTPGVPNIIFLMNFINLWIFSTFNFLIICYVNVYL